MTTTIRGSDNFDTADNATQTELDNKVVGKVLQVVHGTYTTTVSTTSDTYVDTNLSATITPSSTSSKILVIVDQANISANATASGVDLMLLRGSTQIFGFCAYVHYSSQGGSNQGTNYLDSPATTSAVTYKTQFKRGAGSATVYVNDNHSDSGITLMEIAG